MGVVANWIVIAMLALGAWLCVVHGLTGKVEPEKTNGAAHVLAGCVILVVCGFAAYGLWTRYGLC